MTAKGQAIWILFLLTLLNLPVLVQTIAPIAFTIAAIFTLSNLNGDSELAAISAAGASRKAVYRPVLVLATFVMIAVSLSHHFIAPASLAAFRGHPHPRARRRDRHGRQGRQLPFDRGQADDAYSRKGGGRQFPRHLRQRRSRSPGVGPIHGRRRRAPRPCRHVLLHPAEWRHDPREPAQRRQQRHTLRYLRARSQPVHGARRLRRSSSARALDTCRSCSGTHPPRQARSARLPPWSTTGSRLLSTPSSSR